MEQQPKVTAAVPSGDDESADAAVRKVFFELKHTYVKFGLANKEENASGVLRIIEKFDGCHIEWKPSINESPPSLGDGKDGWAVVNVQAVGFTNNKTFELEEMDEMPSALASTGPLFTHSKLQRVDPVNFHISDLKSFKLKKLSLTRQSCITFILSCGSTLPPIFFPKGGSHKFIEQLEKKAVVKQSTNDPGLFLVSLHQPEELITSFDALNLFEDQGSALKRFASDPVRGTLSAFAKVSGMLSDALIATPDTRPTFNPGFHEELRHSIEEELTTTMNSTQEPDFLLVDQKVTLPEGELKQRISPLDISSWHKYLSAGREIDVDLVKCHILRGGVSPALRSEVWKYLLSYVPWHAATEERNEIVKKKHDEYFMMKAQWRTFTDDQLSRFDAFRERKTLIEKDVNRTDRTNPHFSGDGNEKLCELHNVLMTYVMYNFDLGYVQGMSDLLSPLLIVMGCEEDAFWCFVGFMHIVESNFEMDQEGMKLQLNQLNQLLQVVDNELYNYLDSQDCSNMFFTFRWLLILFKREFSMDEIMSLWEVIWTGLPCKNYQLIIAASLLVKSRNVIMESGFTFNEILKHINDQAGRIDLNDLLVRSEALAERLLKCTNLPSYIRDIIGHREDGESYISAHDRLDAANCMPVRKQAPPRPEKAPCKTTH